jgi:very-short-patch-repair endonuclease
MDLDELLRRQSGVVTRRQALDSGLSARQLRPGKHRLVRLRHGVFADAERLGDPSDAVRTAVRVAGVRLVNDVDLVAVGPTAAVLHGIPLLGSPPTRLHLAERKQDRPHHHGASTTLSPAEIVHVAGVPVTSLARTAVDVARARGAAPGVVAADAVLARHVPRSALDAVLQGMDRWSGVQQAREAVAFADRRSESPLESFGRWRFSEQGLPAPDLQVWLGDELGSFARVDHYWEAHRTVAEADGALKYGTPADLFDEKRREDRLRDAGYEIVRYTWDDALHTPQLLAARLRRGFERAARRRAA